MGQKGWLEDDDDDVRHGSYNIQDNLLDDGYPFVENFWFHLIWFDASELFESLFIDWPGQDVRISKWEEWLHKRW